eukprot:7262609-Prorocentrum_lima.AAC.1
MEEEVIQAMVDDKDGLYEPRLRMALEGDKEDPPEPVQPHPKSKSKRMARPKQKKGDRTPDGDE